MSRKIAEPIKEVKCWHCGGTGVKVWLEQGFADEATCVWCKGTGIVKVEVKRWA